MPTAVDVFTPNGTPTFTYVQNSKAESNLRNAIDVPNIIVSVSGPSKSGKTVLINKIVGKENLITIPGPSITIVPDLWDNVLQWMESPASLSNTESGTTTVSSTAKIGGSLGVPFVAKGNAEANIGGAHASTSQTTSAARVGGMHQVAKEISNSAYVVFIDDFHYIPKNIQSEIGRQIKSAAELGIKIVTASVPHRSDDVVRSNPELIGRVIAVDLAYWDSDSLVMIPKRGFAELNIDLAPSVEKGFAREAFGSPQLMQTICLNLCMDKQLREALPNHSRIDISESEIRQVLTRTTAYTDYSTLLEALHAGPKQRGTERKLFDLTDGSKGDVYRAVLTAVGQDPAQLSFRYDQIMSRIKNVCVSDSPVGSSVSEALKQMEGLADIVSPTAKVVEWDENVLDIVDPYFIFYLRFSNKISSLTSK